MRSQPLAERRSAFTDVTDATRSLEDSANLPSALPSRVPGFPRHTQSLGASRRKAGALPALDPDIVAQEIVEDLQAALAQSPKSHLI